MYGRNFVAWRRMRRMRPWKTILLILIVLLIALCIYQTHRGDPHARQRQSNRRYRENAYEFSPDPTTPFLFENTSPKTAVACQKSVHIFGNLTDMKTSPELTHFYKYFARSKRKDHEVFFRCEEQDCILRVTLGSSVSLFKEKDAVIFGMLPKAFKGNMDVLLRQDPGIGQTWFYYSTHTPHQIVQWNEDMRVTQLKYHKIMTYRSDSDVHMPFGYFRKFNRSEKRSLEKQSSFGELVQNRSKQVVWTENNCERRNFWPLLPMMQRLQKQIQIDDFGDCGGFSCTPKRSTGCRKLFQRYNFLLSLSNTECYEYITDSFWRDALTEGIIPVVYGASKADFELLAPPNSFIHVSNFSHGKDLVKYMKEVASSPEKFNGYFKWKKEGEIVNSYPRKMCTLCRTIPHLGDNWEVLQLGNSSWYDGCRTRPDERLLQPFELKQHRWDYILWNPWLPEAHMTPKQEKQLRIDIGKF